MTGSKTSNQSDVTILPLINGTELSIHWHQLSAKEIAAIDDQWLDQNLASLVRLYLQKLEEKL